MVVGVAAVLGRSLLSAIAVAVAVAGALLSALLERNRCHVAGMWAQMEQRCLLSAGEVVCQHCLVFNKSQHSCWCCCLCPVHSIHSSCRLL